MPYSDFTLEEIAKKLGVTTSGAALFPTVQAIPVPAWLTVMLTKVTPLSFLTEKARSEAIISPVMMAAREITDNRLAIFSGQRLDVDAAKGLVGECDFILSIAEPVLPLRSPLVTVVEAKKADIELGLGQCVAQMIGARTFNAAAGQGDRPVFGCITSGEVWQFLRLSGPVAVQDTRRYPLADLGLILGVFRAMVAAVESLTPTAAP